jgi:hypothetical protein
MKKGMLLVAAVVAVTFASCKKEWTCECTYSDSSGTHTISGTTKKESKKDAKDECNGTATAGGTSWSCSIK